MRLSKITMLVLILILTSLPLNILADDEKTATSKKPDDPKSTDYASVFIATLGLGLAIFNGYETRKHNKLSVMPHLVFGEVYSEGDDKKIGLNLVNNGLGPAIIKHFLFSVADYKDGKYIKYYEDSEWKNALHTLGLTDCLTGGRLKIIRWREGDSIASKEESWIFAYQVDDNDTAEKQYFLKTLAKIKFHIDYQSIYQKGTHDFQTTEFIQT